MSTGKKGGSTPVRFAPEEEAFLNDVQLKTGLSKSELIRRAVRYAGPRFLSGEVNILTLAEAEKS